MEAEYREQVRESFLQQMEDQEQMYEDNMQQCSRLEHEERVMVEKLNQTRMSALSAQSHNRKFSDDR